MSADLEQRIAEVVAAVDFGTPSAVKRGRRPEWPYVPIIVLDDVPGGRTSQIMGKAFATRAEAVEYAAAHIARQRVYLAGRLADPRHRAERAQYGLPWEIRS